MTLGRALELTTAVWTPCQRHAVATELQRRGASLSGDGRATTPGRPPRWRDRHGASRLHQRAGGRRRHGGLGADAEDATLLPPSTDVVRGRQAIEIFWRAGIEAGISDIELEALETERHDGLAYEIGRYAIRLKPADGGRVVDRGKYLLVHTRRPDGSWQRRVEMFNADAAAAERGRRTESVAINPPFHRSSNRRLDQR